MNPPRRSSAIEHDRKMYGTMAEGPGAMVIFDADPVAAGAITGVAASTDGLRDVKVQRLFSGDEVRVSGKSARRFTRPSRRPANRSVLGRLACRPRGLSLSLSSFASASAPGSSGPKAAGALASRRPGGLVGSAVTTTDQGTGPPAADTESQASCAETLQACFFRALGI